MDRFEHEEGSKSARANVRSRAIEYDRERRGDKKEKKAPPTKEKAFIDEQENAIRQVVYEESVASIKAVCSRHQIAFALSRGIMGMDYLKWDGEQLRFNVYNRDDDAPNRGVHRIELEEIDDSRFIIRCSLLALEDGGERIMLQPQFKVIGRFGACPMPPKEVETLRYYLFTHSPQGHGRATLLEQTEEDLAKLQRERDIREQKEVYDSQRKRSGRGTT